MKDLPKLRLTHHGDYNLILPFLDPHQSNCLETMSITNSILLMCLLLPLLRAADQPDNGTVKSEADRERRFGPSRDSKTFEEECRLRRCNFAVRLTTTGFGPPVCWEFLSCNRVDDSWVWMRQSSDLALGSKAKEGETVAIVDTGKRPAFGASSREIIQWMRIANRECVLEEDFVKTIMHGEITINLLIWDDGTITESKVNIESSWKEWAICLQAWAAFNVETEIHFRTSIMRLADAPWQTIFEAIKKHGAKQK